MTYTMNFVIHFQNFLSKQNYLIDIYEKEKLQNYYIFQYRQIAQKIRNLLKIMPPTANGNHKRSVNVSSLYHYFVFFESLLKNKIGFVENRCAP